MTKQRIHERTAAWWCLAGGALPMLFLVLGCSEAQSPAQTGDSMSNLAAAAGAPGGDGSEAATSAAAECIWPSVDADAPGACQVGRALMRCTSPDVGALCITEQNGRCEGLDDRFSCENLCEAGEYATSCGSIGGGRPGSAVAQEPPAACRSVAPTPGGIVFYCCPCEAGTLP